MRSARCTSRRSSAILATLICSLPGNAGANPLTWFIKLSEALRAGSTGVREIRLVEEGVRLSKALELGKAAKLEKAAEGEALAAKASRGESAGASMVDELTAAGSERAIVRSERFHAAMEHWREADPLAQARAMQRLKSVESIGDLELAEKALAAPVPLSTRNVLELLPPRQAAILKPLDHEPYRIGAISIVDVRMKQFIARLKESARTFGVNRVRPEVGELWQRWNTAPIERRVFIVGSGKDAATVRALQAQLEPQGIQLFFYRFCEELTGHLCPDRVVGAFGATAGHHFILDTPYSRASEYVAYEAAALRQMRGDGGVMILLVSGDLERATIAKSVAVFVVPRLTCQVDDGDLRAAQVQAATRLADEMFGKRR